MISRAAALNKASSTTTINESFRKHLSRAFASRSSNGSPMPSPLAVLGEIGPRARTSITSITPRQLFASISESQKQRKREDRDFLLTVLETSVTKRDARAYMKKFVPLLESKGATNFKERATQQTAKNAKGTAQVPDYAQHDAQATSPGTPTVLEPVYVALVKIRAPQLIDDATLTGVGRTLGKLKKLGLTSIVVVDCDLRAENEAEKQRATYLQASRIATAIDHYDAPGARIIQSPFTIGNSIGKDTSPFTSEDLFVGNPKDLMDTLRDEIIPVVPSIGYTEDLSAFRSVDSNEAVLALARQLSGLQFLGQPMEDAQVTRMLKSAEVYRLIILDPVGGIPALNRATGRHMFLNLEQEYEEVTRHLKQTSTADESTAGPRDDNYYHLKNAELARKAMSLLPPTSSAIITTPQEAANDRAPDEVNLDWALVGTRRKLNPLIHNLLTDRPVQSSSLPSGRIRQIVSSSGEPSRIGSLTTLAKRGMPLTIFPDPRISPWRPPQPGETRLKLTDPCIDLGRLVHLINDSFGRTLDVDHYLRRIQDSLAGIIIAGEYEGGAILTWESPAGVEEGPEKVDPSRMIPYLDKFAVLRKSQGAGGVADIVFNAMVRDCFPDGVCWRSRKNNPVNKWYFERSRGTMKIKDMNWTMFWTTPDLSVNQEMFKDYESVCRRVEPSWADKKPPE